MLKISAGDTWVVHPLGPKWQLCCSVGARGSSEPVQSELQSAHTQVSSSSIDIKTALSLAQTFSASPDIGSLPALLSIWLVPPWWTQVCLTLGSYWIQAFFSMIYLDSCWCTTSGRVEDWISAAVINFACTHNLFLPRSCFPNTLMCLAAFTSFGGWWITWRAALWLESLG